MQTTAETLSVNGVVLNTLAKNIESLTGRLTVPSIRTANITVPGRHGGMRTTRKMYDQGQIVLPMWVRGCNDDGEIPTSSTARREFFTNVDTLTKLFRPGNGMLEILHTLPDGSVRRAWAECVEAIDFSVKGYNPIGRFSVALIMPDPFWEDRDLLTLNLNIAQNGVVPALDGTTAPIDDMTITIVGPATNCKIEAFYDGFSLENPTWLQYNSTVSAGQTLVINCDRWSLVGTGGHVVNYSNLVHKGGAKWLTIVPGLPGRAPELKISASNTNANSKVTFQIRRKFLVG